MKGHHHLFALCLIACLALIFTPVAQFNKAGPAGKFQHAWNVAAKVSYSVAVVNILPGQSVDRSVYEGLPANYIDLKRAITASTTIYAKPQNDRRCVKPERVVNHSPPIRGAI